MKSAKFQKQIDIKEASRNNTLQLDESPFKINIEEAMKRILENHKLKKYS